MNHLRKPVMRTYGAGLVLVSLLSLAGVGYAQSDELSLDIPSVVLVGVPFEVTVSLADGHGLAGETAIEVEGAEVTSEAQLLQVVDAETESVSIEGLMLVEGGEASVTVRVGDSLRAEQTVRALPGWLSFLPPLLAIGLALWFRQVLISLFAGVWFGAFLLGGFNPVTATLRSIDKYAVDALADADHASILIFSLLLGGMIALITGSGGGLGLAVLVAKRAKSAVKAQLSTWAMGLVIFFDDYANSLLVGSSMRPITDRLRVSREKLAFVVDATAAPVASIALISSWIGVEIGYIGEQYSRLGLEGDPYLIFLETIPYRFYPLLMLFFVVACIWMRRDFGPMRRAELRARHEGKVLRDGAEPASEFGDDEVEMAGVTPRPMNAIIPIFAVILTAIAGMVYTGLEALGDQEVTLRGIFGEANSYAALLWASLAGGLVAATLILAQRSMNLAEVVKTWMKGLRSMLFACCILLLAWSLNAVCDELMTAQYLIQILGDWLNPSFLPLTVFIVAAVVSFATGTSWGTMAILFPLVVPMAHELAPGQEGILLGAISSILTGAVWGDHCSPISDTTIMSSMASSCDHMDHVRTQIPYALTVGMISILVGELGTAMGFYPAWVGLLLGAVAIVLVLRFVGRDVEDFASPTAAEKPSTV